MTCGVGHSLDPSLLWLWRRLAATAPIRSLDWEPPYATGAALKSKKKKNPQTNKNCNQDICVENNVIKQVLLHLSLYSQFHNCGEPCRITFLFPACQNDFHIKVWQ